MANSISPGDALVPSGSGRPVAGRRKLALAGAILAVLAAPLSMMALTDGSAGAVVEKGRDFLALMQDRSPGERTVAQLTKSKKVRAAAVVPKQRALAKVQKPPVPKEFLEALVPVEPQLAELPPAILNPPGIVPFDLVPPLEIVPLGPGGPVVTPPGGPGGPVVFPPGGGTPPTVIPPPPPPPEVPAVPEPSTWLSMLLGFGLLGSVCRYRRRTVARA